jgi:hypothetical protein
LRADHHNGFHSCSLLKHSPRFAGHSRGPQAAPPPPQCPERNTTGGKRQKQQFRIVRWPARLRKRPLISADGTTDQECPPSIAGGETLPYFIYGRVGADSRSRATARKVPCTGSS